MRDFGLLLLRFAIDTNGIMKGRWNDMITFSVLLGVILAIALVVAFITLICGGTFILVFGDFIVCGAIVVLLVKLFQRKKK